MLVVQSISLMYATTAYPTSALHVWHLSPSIIELNQIYSAGQSALQYKNDTIIHKKREKRTPQLVLT